MLYVYMCHISTCSIFLPVLYFYLCYISTGVIFLPVPYFYVFYISTCVIFLPVLYFYLRYISTVLYLSTSALPSHGWSNMSSANISTNYSGAVFGYFYLLMYYSWLVQIFTCGTMRLFTIATLRNWIVNKNISFDFQVFDSLQVLLSKLWYCAIVSSSRAA